MRFSSEHWLISHWLVNIQITRKAFLAWKSLTNLNQEKSPWAFQLLLYLAFSLGVTIYMLIMPLEIVICKLMIISMLLEVLLYIFFIFFQSCWKCVIESSRYTKLLKCYFAVLGRNVLWVCSAGEIHVKHRLYRIFRS